MRKHIVYSLICALLCMAMLAVCFVGCSDGTDNTDGTVGEGLSTDSSDNNQSVLTIADNGESEYSIYYDMNLASDQTFISIVGTMSKLINSGTGAQLQMSTDRYYSDVIADKPAILIGVTQWAESQQIASELAKINDYYIGIVGNKLVICAKSAEACTTAVQYFINKIITPQVKAGKTLTFSSNDTYKEDAKYGIDSVKVLDTELCEYRFVIPKNADLNESFFAYQLRYWLMNSYGVLLDIVDDSAEVAEHEILVGNTSRSSTQPKQNEYSVKAAEGKLELSAMGYIAYDELYNYVTKTLIPSGSSASYTISERSDTVDAVQGYEQRTESALAGDGDVRAMFYNIYGWENYSTSERMQMQLELFKAYSPDIIGMQEFSGNVRSGELISKLDELGYAEVTVSGVTSNFTPLFYLEDKLEVVESGYLLYEGINDVNSKSVTWAVFSDKQTSERFIAMSTHFYWESTEEGDAARLSEAGQLIELIATIRGNSDYASLPLIMGGDLNCTGSSEPAGVLSEGGLSFAHDVASSKNNVSTHHKNAVYSDEYKTYTTTYRPSGDYANAIDQVWISSGVEVDSFVTLTATYTLIASDHCPVLVDISF